MNAPFKNGNRDTFAAFMCDDAALDVLRSIVVDMGWPSDDRAYADVATFGASRLVGRALIELLDRGPTEQAVEAP